MDELRPSEAAKKAFGVRLRELRLDAGLTGVALATACGWHNTKVSKIEHGRTTPSENDIRSWAAACRAAAQTAELIAAHRQIDQMWAEWRRELRAGQRHIQGRALARYAATRLLRVYEPLVVPGILQTLDYARAILTINARLHGLPPEDVEQAARNRVARRLLVTSGGGTTFSFVMEAAALHVVYGSPDILREQLDFLADVARRPNVALGVVPFDVPRTQFAGEGFYLFDDREVRQEFWSGGFRTSRPDDIAHFARVFTLLHAQAVYGAPARQQIEQARARL
ncbi:helix-turn-helix transcriptional regulator [Actinocorallia sp. API 0066]|uniref:helix-turn-helix domain-containing protein n=1 Tax=Actinocorallia sp. API 0066 TaxID=2896846 RepID=UPI001E353696|nr:helix-turn-helix transcriptional regulator [Actinocorallia sp. API 0066]MCD0453079.1 helix-turn-helix transcriptional regulator [Actinocorallia sp. API 0066]